MKYDIRNKVLSQIKKKITYFQIGFFNICARGGWIKEGIEIFPVKGYIEALMCTSQLTCSPKIRSNLEK
jgi:hypothetical protein